MSYRGRPRFARPLEPIDQAGSSYFCQVQDAKYYSYTEHIPDGPTTKRMQALAFDCVEQVRQTWQFFRDRRAEAYADLVRP